MLDSKLWNILMPYASQETEEKRVEFRVRTAPCPQVHYNPKQPKQSYPLNLKKPSFLIPPYGIL